MPSTPRIATRYTYRRNAASFSRPISCRSTTARTSSELPIASGSPGMKSAAWSGKSAWSCGLTPARARRSPRIRRARRSPDCPLHRPPARLAPRRQGSLHPPPSRACGRFPTMRRWGILRRRWASPASPWTCRRISHSRPRRLGRSSRPKGQSSPPQRNRPSPSQPLRLLWGLRRGRSRRRTRPRSLHRQ